MQIDFSKGKALKSLVRWLCFMAIGISAMANPLYALNLYNIIIGAITGLLFGWLFKTFLKGFLSMFNGSFRKERGRDAIRYATDNGMLFLVPFALMLLLATFYLNWSMTVPFISAGLMAVGTASGIEMGRLLGKQGIKNTIAASGVSFLFSFLWILSFPILYRAPSIVEGGVMLIRSLLGGGGI